MKKLVSLISALTMCAVMAAPMVSSAANSEITQESETKTANIVVDYTPTESYTITIPDSVSIDTPINVEATKACLRDGVAIKVSVDTIDGLLKYKEDSIGYTISSTEGEEVTLVSSGEATGTKTFDVNLTGDKEPLFANKYTATATFTVSVDETNLVTDDTPTPQGEEA